TNSRILLPQAPSRSGWSHVARLQSLLPWATRHASDHLWGVWLIGLSERRLLLEHARRDISPGVQNPPGTAMKTLQAQALALVGAIVLLLGCGTTGSLTGT